MVNVHMIDSKYPRESVGYIPQWLSESNPKSAAEQLNTGYSFAGVWQPFDGFTFDSKTLGINYPGDPTLYPIAMMILRNEKVYVYPYSWVLIYNTETKTHGICRMD